MTGTTEVGIVLVSRQREAGELWALLWFIWEGMGKAGCRFRIGKSKQCQWALGHRDCP